MRTITLLLLSSVSLSCLVCPSVLASEIIAGPLSIQEPAGDTWKLLRKNFFGAVFARSEAPGLTETIAYSSSYAATGPLDAQGLLAEVKRNVDQFLTAPNVKVLSTDFEPRTNRAYPCVYVSAFAQVVTPGWQQRLLICQPLGNTQFGFVAGFSYSSAQVIDTLESQARLFLEGIQVAPK